MKPLPAKPNTPTCDDPDPYCSFVFGMGGPTSNQIGIPGSKDSKAQSGAMLRLAAALGSAAV